MTLFWLNKPPPPYDPQLPLASICPWPYHKEGEWPETVLEVYLRAPQQIERRYRIAIRRRRPVWEPIQEIMDMKGTT